MHTTTLFYRTKGSPDRPPLLILHGLWGASDNWLPVAELLSEYFYVILPDLRNHGNSPHLPEHNYELMSEDITTFIRSLHLNTPPFITGHSMGGKTVMHLLHTHPQLISKAAILDIAPVNYTQEPNEHSDLIRFMIDFKPEEYPNRQALNHSIREHYTNEAEVQLLLKNIRKTEKGFTWKVNIKAIKNNLANILKWDIEQSPISTSPILFVKGGDSGYITENDLPRIKRYFPKADLITLPHAGHRLHCDQPVRLAELLIHFFLPGAAHATPQQE